MNLVAGCYADCFALGFCRAAAVLAKWYVGLGVFLASVREQQHSIACPLSTPFPQNS